MTDTDNTCWLGLDLGTTSVKVTVVDACGSVLSSESRPTSADVSSDVGDRGSEQDPNKIIAVVEDLIHNIASPHKEKLKGIGITGQMHGVMLWTKRDQSAEHQCDSRRNSRLYTWQDQRCTEEFLACLPKPSDPKETVSTGFGCATLFWLVQHRPALVKELNYSACGTVMDYLVYQLCGLDHPFTSDQLAASFGYYCKQTGAWDTVLKECENFPHNLLPHILPAGTIVGQTVEYKGLPQGIPVLVAMGDVQCAMHAVLTSHQDAAVNISTSIQLGFIVPKERESDIVENSPTCISFFPYFNNQQLALCAGLNGGNTIQCFAESICQWINDLGIESGITPSSLLSKLQQLSEKGPDTSSSPTTSSSAPIIKPALFGERHNKAMKASITGLDFSNFGNLRLLFGALCEGIVDHLHSMVPTHYLVGLGFCRLLVSGSVPARNKAVMNRLRTLYSGDDCPGGSGAPGAASGSSSFTGEESRPGTSDSSQVGHGDHVGRAGLEVVVDMEGLEAVSSAVGAARLVSSLKGD